jgi:ABC-2 type transport system ATP-binding protein
MTGERTLDCTVEPGSGTEATAVADALAALPGVLRVESLEDPGGAGWRFRIQVGGESASFVAPVAQAVSATGGRLTDARLGEPNLEDVFIHLTGRALR